MLMRAEFCLLVFALCLASTYGFYKLSETENMELQSICGIPLSNGDSLKGSNTENVAPKYKIYGGEMVPDGEMPWALMIFTYRGVTCSGTLISRWHFVTAAHCLVRDRLGDGWAFADVDPYRAYATYGGSSCLDDIPKTLERFNLWLSVKACERTKRSRLLRVRAVIAPKSSFNFVTKHVKAQLVDESEFFFSDIAIFELAEPFEADDADLRPICMTQNSFAAESRNLVMRAFGYGYTEKKTSASIVQTQLWSLNLTDPTLPSCSTLLGCPGGSLGYVEFSRHRSQAKSLCVGDSGGGLVMVLDRRSILLGVYSFGRSFCVTDADYSHYTEAFTRLDLHIGFVCRHTGICPPNYNVSAENVEDAVFLGESTVYLRTTTEADRRAATTHTIGHLNPQRTSERQDDGTGIQLSWKRHQVTVPSEAASDGRSAIAIHSERSGISKALGNSATLLSVLLVSQKRS